MSEPRLLQVFLSKTGHGVYEVSVAVHDHALSCTCPGFKHRKRCKHIDFVAEKLGPDGEYTVTVPHLMPMDILVEARRTPESWRAFITRYVTPEVL
jgi:uncharacterized Zn finger protein